MNTVRFAWLVMLGSVGALHGCDRNPAQQLAQSSASGEITAAASASAPAERELVAEGESASFDFKRIGAASAFDPSRGLLYVWGGALEPLRAGGKPLRADPGLLDIVDVRAGRSEQQRMIGTIPSGIHVPAMAFDARGTGALYVFGGWPELRP